MNSLTRATDTRFEKISAKAGNRGIHSLSAPIARNLGRIFFPSKRVASRFPIPLLAGADNVTSVESRPITLPSGRRPNADRNETDVQTCTPRLRDWRERPRHFLCLKNTSTAELPMRPTASNATGSRCAANRCRTSNSKAKTCNWRGKRLGKLSLTSLACKQAEAKSLSGATPAGKRRGLLKGMHANEALRAGRTYNPTTRPSGFESRSVHQFAGGAVLNRSLQGSCFKPLINEPVILSVTGRRHSQPNPQGFSSLCGDKLRAATRAESLAPGDNFHGISFRGPSPRSIRRKHSNVSAIATIEDLLITNDRGDTISLKYSEFTWNAP
jgi:hypothetical protein